MTPEEGEEADAVEEEEGGVGRTTTGPRITTPTVIVVASPQQLHPTRGLSLTATSNLLVPLVPLAPISSDPIVNPVNSGITHPFHPAPLLSREPLTFLLS